MKKVLTQATKEAFASVMPITVIVLLLSVFVSPMPVGTLGLFLFGAVLLVIGMGLFTMGAEMALLPMGEDIGIKMTTTKKLLIIGLISFLMGTIITIAEPDLQVLARLVPGVPNVVLVWTVACGMGVFLVFAILRILFQISLSKMLIACYVLMIGLSFFVPKNFISMAFDSGGVTTGPITVPFILALGMGVASIRGDRATLEDSFGLVAMGSVGPIVAVLLLGIFYSPGSMEYETAAIPYIETSRDVTLEFAHELPTFFMEMAQALWPLIGVLFIFQLIARRYRPRSLARILVGFIYTYIGLVLFMTGVSVGFIPVGQSIGRNLAESDARWLLIPLGALIGYFIVAAEPAVHILKKQVEEVSLGAIPGPLVQRYLSIGVSASLAIAMLRVLTGLSIYWFIIPGYSIALILTFFVPKIFIGIAFDSGGVVSGPMTSTFLLPFAIGACLNPDNIMTDAFGLVAMVALTPLIALQLMGLIYKSNMAAADAKQRAMLADIADDEIVEFEGDLYDERR